MANDRRTQPTAPLRPARIREVGLAAGQQSSPPKERRASVRRCPLREAQTFLDIASRRELALRALEARRSFGKHLLIKAAKIFGATAMKVLF